MSHDEAQAILDYWLGPAPDDPDEMERMLDRWYGGGEVDREIEARFGSLVTSACEGALDGWMDTDVGSLALIVLLDQFTRNLYRGTPEAYRGDARAIEIAERLVDDDGFDRLSLPARFCALHPFHHSEEPKVQMKGVLRMKNMEATLPPRWLNWQKHFLKDFEHHRDVVLRFGRFPHRNKVLDRKNTLEEEAYLAENDDSFGQAIQDTK